MSESLKTVNSEIVASIEQEPHTAWESSTQLIDSVKTSAYFLDKTRYLEHTSFEYATALSEEVNTLCDDTTVTSRDEAARLRIIGNYPFYTHTRIAIDDAKLLGDSRRAKIHKQHAIRYNHLLSSYLEQHPETQLSDIIRSCFTACSDMTPNADSYTSENGLFNALRGARTEAIMHRQFMLLADNVNNPQLFECRTGSDEEDARGGDIVATINGTDFFVDIKTTINGLDTTSQDDLARGFTIKRPTGRDVHPSLTLTPWFDDNDLGDTCQLPKDIEKISIRKLYIQLNSAYKQYQALS